MMEQEMIDLSYLTEKERAQIEAVIDADQELRIQGLRLMDSNLCSTSPYAQRSAPQLSPRNDPCSVSFQQLHLKLESDHRYASELLRRSLTAASDQRSESGIYENGSSIHDEHKKRHAQAVKDSLPYIREISSKTEKSELNYQIIVKSSSTDSLNSLSSMYSASAGKGDYDITGKVELDMWYKDGQLCVHVIQAKGLAATKSGSVTNPYVKLHLLPGRGKQFKRKTGVHKKTTNPHFDETLKIKVEQSHVSSCTLWLSVWDWDTFGRNQFLGEIRLLVSSLDLTRKQSQWYTLQDEKENSTCDDYSSRLKVGLMYKPQAKIRSEKKNISRIVGTLHVAIHQAEDLPAIDEHSLTDATVKLYLLPNQSSSGKRKTKVVNKNLNPVWDEQFTYKNVYMDDLSSQRVLEVTVWDYDRRGSNDFIGGLRIGPHLDYVPHGLKDWMDSIGDEVSHWEAMLKRPGEWVERWHDLRPSMKPASKVYAPISQKYLHTLNVNNTCDVDDEDTTICDVDEDFPPALLSDGPKRSHSDERINTVKSITPKDVVNVKEARMDVEDSIDPSSITGDVLMGVYYKRNELHIHMNRARGLASADSNGYSDPYIKIYLQSDSRKYAQQKSSIKKKTLNPIYHETVMYNIPESELNSLTLQLRVCDWNRFGSNQFLGEISLPLYTLDLTDSADHWYELHDKNVPDANTSVPLSLTTSVVNVKEARMDVEDSVDPSSITGDVLMGVYYKRNELHIHMNRARGLASADSNGYSDPYIKIYLQSDSRKYAQQKTSIKKKTLNPIYHETVMYTIPESELNSLTLRLRVCDWNRFGSNQFLGEISLPVHSLDLTDSADHWYELHDKNVPDANTSPLLSLSTSGSKSSTAHDSENKNTTSPDILDGFSFSLPKMSHPHGLPDADQESAQVKIEVIEEEGSEVERNEEFSIERLTFTPTSKELAAKRSQSGPSPLDQSGSTNVAHYKTDFTITGKVLVGVYYKNSELHIHVNRAEGLVSADSNGYSDPYIKIYLLPDKEKYGKRKTSIKKKTLDPVYNETFKYKVSKSELNSRTVWLSVWDWDRLSTNDYLGEVRIPLSSLNLTDTSEHWYHLQDKDDGRQTIAELQSRSMTSFEHLQASSVPTCSASSVNEPVLEFKSTSNNEVSHSKDTSEVGSVSSFGSLTSIYSGAGGKGDYDITGEVLLGVCYKNNQLHILVERAKGLTAIDSDGYSNPYVKTYLLPDNDKRKTKVKQRTLDPVYNETLLYDLPKSELNSRTLWLSVWDWNKFGRNQFLGEIRIPLSSFDLNVMRSQWYQLQDQDESVASENNDSHRGELRVGLKFLPSEGSKETGTLVVDIKQAKDLTAMDSDSTDSVVTLYLLPSQNQNEKRKTGVIKHSLNPVWEEKFTFENVNLDELSCERALEVSVWSHEKSCHTFIGGLRIGPAPGSGGKQYDWMDSVDDEVTHWEDMLACPGEWVEQWHTLRSTMDPRDNLDLYTYFSIISES